MKRTIARNILFNWSARLAEAATGFFVAPFLVHHLGDSRYGLWTVIASLTGYFGLLDLGIRSSVGRYVAFHRAKEDRDSLRATYNTAALLLGSVGLIGLIGMALVQLFFFHVFDVPAADVAAARWTLFLVGLNLAVMFPLTLFDAVLWGFQRFDVVGSTDALSALLRAGLTFWLIGTGHGLVALALITLSTTLAAGLFKALLCYRQDPGLRFGLRYLRRGTAPALFSYSVWRALMALGRISSTRINPLIIGSWLGMALVTPYALAVRIMGYTGELFVTARTVLIPVATTYEAQEKHEWQEGLMLRGGQYCTAFSLFFLPPAILLGDVFLALWVGPHLAYAGRLLALLLCGELLAMSQSITTSTLLGLARHRALALAGLAEIILSIVLALALAGPYGLLGVCLAQAAAATACRGLFQMIYACRVVSLPIGTYLQQAMLPAAVAALPPSLLLTALVGWYTPAGWTGLLLYGAAYSLVYLICCSLSLEGGRARVAALRQRVFSLGRPYTEGGDLGNGRGSQENGAGPLYAGSARRYNQHFSPNPGTTGEAV